MFAHVDLLLLLSWIKKECMLIYYYSCLGLKRGVCAFIILLFCLGVKWSVRRL